MLQKSWKLPQRVALHTYKRPQKGQDTRHITTGCRLTAESVYMSAGGGKTLAERSTRMDPHGARRLPPAMAKTITKRLISPGIQFLCYRFRRHGGSKTGGTKEGRNSGSSSSYGSSAPTTRETSLRDDGSAATRQRQERPQQDRPCGRQRWHYKDDTCSCGGQGQQASDQRGFTVYGRRKAAARVAGIRTTKFWENRVKKKSRVQFRDSLEARDLN